MADRSSGAEPGAELRALAAHALARIRAGRSLREELERLRPRLADARDRAQLTALVLAGLRGHFRWQALRARLLARPLPEREAALAALIDLGLAQLDDPAVPAHAAVAATVAAARVLGRPGHAGLVNAVLRRYQRERQTLAAALAGDEEARLGHPAWLISALRADWGEATAARILAANLERAPLWLRVNPARASREGLLAALAERGIRAEPDPGLPLALRLPEPCDPRELPGFAEGGFSVQDGSGQWAAVLLAVRPGDRVLDACAAPGGKTAALLATRGVEVVAVESAPERRRRLAENLARLGLEARLVLGDAGAPAAWWDGRPFDRVLLDAPCSATGVIRRQPDVRLHRRPQDLAALCAAQARLLEALWPLLRPGGRLLYATCSVLRDENDRLVAAFLGRHPEARSVPLALPHGRPLPPGWQILPGDGAMDGFFLALLERADGGLPAR